MYQDKIIVCKDCGNQFTFTVGEQAFYSKKGFENEPVRCKDCRDKRKVNKETSNYKQTKPRFLDR